MIWWSFLIKNIGTLHANSIKIWENNERNEFPLLNEIAQNSQTTTSSRIFEVEENHITLVSSTSVYTFDLENSDSTLCSSGGSITGSILRKSGKLAFYDGDLYIDEFFQNDVNNCLHLWSTTVIPLSSIEIGLTEIELDHILFEDGGNLVIWDIESNTFNTISDNTYDDILDMIFTI